MRKAKINNKKFPVLSRQALINQTISNRGGKTLARAAARDIAQNITPVANPQRRESCRTNLELFLKTYFPEFFSLPFSNDHLKVIKSMQASIITGGNYALGMPRSSGKTTICECSVLFAMLYGYRKFVVLVSASSESANIIQENIKTSIETNELLAEDFPEMIIPIKLLDGISARAKSQTCNGIPTKISWTKNELVLPTMYDKQNNLITGSGARIMGRGILSGFRGLARNYNGEKIRPDFLLIDDIQTTESANSVSQCKEREGIINGDLLGLAGVKKSIAAVLTCTVIRKDDLADRLLDRNIFPFWNGERYKAMYQFPKNKLLWEEYFKIRKLEQMDGDRKSTKANEFYLLHRKEMDDGAEISWEHRYNPDELSAIQHCQNIICDRGLRIFQSEYNNSPLSEEAQTLTVNTKEVLTRINQFKRLEVPKDTVATTAFCDINLYGLHYSVVSFTADMRARVIAYGRYPEHGVLADKTKDNATIIEQKLIAGLSAVEQKLKDMQIVINRFGIDAGYLPDVVKKWLEWRRVGAYVATKGLSSRYYKQTSHDLLQFNNVHLTETPVSGRLYIFNSDFYKEKMLLSLKCAPEVSGATTLYNADKDVHLTYAEHITAETLREKVKGNDKTYYEWESNRIHDYGDSLYGCFVLATICGLGKSVQIQSSNSSQPTTLLPQPVINKPKKRRTVSYQREDY